MLTTREAFQLLFGYAQSYFSVYKERVGVVQLSTLSLYLLSVSFSLAPSLFSFLSFFFSAAMQLLGDKSSMSKQVFLSLAAFILHSKTTQFPPIEFSFFFLPLSQLMIITIQKCCNVGKHWSGHILLCCHNVDSLCFQIL